MKVSFLLPMLLLFVLLPLAIGHHRGLSPIRTSLQQKSPTNPTINSSDWKTYTNQEYAFSLKYPQEWSVVSEERGNIIEMLSFRAVQSYGSSGLPAGQFQITIAPEWAINNDENVSDWCRKQLITYRYSPEATIKILNEHNTTVGGLPASVINSRAKYVIDGRITDDKDWVGNRQVCIAKGDTKIGIIGRPLDSQYLPIFNKILATFTLVNP